VVKFSAKSGKLIQRLAHDVAAHPVAIAGFFACILSGPSSVFVEMNEQFDTSHWFANCGTGCGGSGLACPSRQPCLQLLWQLQRSMDNCQIPEVLFPTPGRLIKQVETPKIQTLFPTT
jgi:hypothetical protein